MYWNPKDIIVYAEEHSIYRWLKTEKSIENVIDKLNKERYVCVVL